MGNTLVPLVIGCIGGIAFAYPDKYQVKSGGPVQVIVVGDCSVCFEKHDVFDDKKHKGRKVYKWTPKADGNATYTIGAYKSKCPPKHIEKTYSVKVGSRLRHAKG